jgi:CDP-diacylglycerol--glycerol-3-phosphate 3-phosphatidyltransferase
VRQIKSGVRRLAEPLARGLIRLGVSANAITLVGLLLNCVAGAIAAIGLLWLAGLCYLLFSSLDFLDGSVARLSGTANRFGAFFDSVLDRAAEAAVLIGLLYWYAGQQQPVLATLCAVALTGSFLVSYARARAEGLGLDCEVGLLQRTERIVLLGGGLLLSPLHALVLPAVLVVLIIATGVTTCQRIAHVARLTRAPEPPGS